MIDLHCHILPGVDDGAQTMADSLEMARMAAHSGVRAIVATPHCNVPNSPMPNYLDETLMNRVMQLRDEIDYAGIPLRLYAGAEVFCTPPDARSAPGAETAVCGRLTVSVGGIFL